MMGNLKSDHQKEVLENHLQCLRAMEKSAEEIFKDARKMRQEFEAEVYTDRLLDELELSVRDYNSIRAVGITTIHELRQFTKEQLRTEKHLPKRVIDEAEEELRHLGLFHFADQEGAI